MESLQNQLENLTITEENKQQKSNKIDKKQKQKIGLRKVGFLYDEFMLNHENFNEEHVERP